MCTTCRSLAVEAIAIGYTRNWNLDLASLRGIPCHLRMLAYSLNELYLHVYVFIKISSLHVFRHALYQKNDLKYQTRPARHQNTRPFALLRVVLFGHVRHGWRNGSTLFLCRLNFEARRLRALLQSARWLNGWRKHEEVWHLLSEAQGTAEDSLRYRCFFR